MITMKRARAMFANRVTVADAVYERDDTHQLKLKTPRKRARKPLGASFRAWARKALAGRQLSPKLARMVSP